MTFKRNITLEITAGASIFFQVHNSSMSWRVNLRRSPLPNTYHFDYVLKKSYILFDNFDYQYL